MFTSVSSDENVQTKPNKKFISNPLVANCYLLAWVAPAPWTAELVKLEGCPVCRQHMSYFIYSLLKRCQSYANLYHSPPRDPKAFVFSTLAFRSTLLEPLFTDLSQERHRELYDLLIPASADPQISRPEHPARQKLLHGLYARGGLGGGNATLGCSAGLCCSEQVKSSDKSAGPCLRVARTLLLRLERCRGTVRTISRPSEDGHQAP